MTTPELGLRDRKRVETRARLEKAATELVLSEGLDGATVDAICESADVSPRTFFNYFDTKEDAVLGLRDIKLTDEMLHEHRENNAGADVATSVMSLLFLVIEPTIAGSHLHEARMEIIKRHPHLLGRHIAHMTGVGDQVTGAVDDLIRVAGTESGQGSSIAVAEIIVGLCSAAARAALKEWAAEGNSAEVHHVQSRAVELARKAIQTLS